MKILRYGLLGLGAFLLFLLLQAPASLITDRIGAHLPGFTVQTVAGTATEGVMQGLQWRGARIEHWLGLATTGAGDRTIGLPAGCRRSRFPTDRTGGYWLGSAMALPKLGRSERHSKNCTLWRVNRTTITGHGGIELQGAPERRGRPTTADGVVHLLNLRITLGQPLTLGDFEVQAMPAVPDGVQGKGSGP